MNPLIRITIKCERSFLALKKVALGVVQVPLRKLLIEPNQYNDNWYSVFRNGKKTEGKVRVSFMLCPDKTQKNVDLGSVSISLSRVAPNPQKTHYFEKQVLDTAAFSADCPVCRKSLISGIVDNIYRCRVCGMAVHGNCRERAKGIFKCVPMAKKTEEISGEPLSDKFLRSIKKNRLNLYDQPIGCL